MKNRPEWHYAKLSSLIILFLSVLVSCEKPEDFGKEIITVPGDQLNVLFNDTTSILAHSVLLDSIQTDETSLSLLGNINDPVFGTTTASIYTHIRLDNSNISFGTNPKLDSIVLGLVMKGEYVSKNIRKIDKLQTIKVFELDSTFYRDSSYYSNQSVAHNSMSIGELTFIPKPYDSITVDSKKYPPMIRVKLNNSFGQKLLNASGTIHLADNGNFLEYVKGLYVEAQKGSNSGSITYIDLLSSYSKVTLFYHNDDDTLPLQQDFIINENSARFTHFDHHDYSTARGDFQAQTMPNGGDTALGAQKLFIQSTGGVRTKLYLPYLSNWVDGKKVAIAKAVLVIPLDLTESSLTTMEPPAKLSLVKIREDGTNAFLIDQISEGETTFGGVYDATRKEYRFTVTRHIQKILNGEPDYGLNLLVSGSAVTANRAILGGTETPYKIRLELTYVELKDN